MKTIYKVTFCASLILIACVTLAPQGAFASTTGSIIINYDNNGGADTDCEALDTPSCVVWRDGLGSAGHVDPGQWEFCKTKAVQYASGLSDISGLNITFEQIAQRAERCMTMEGNNTYKTYRISFTPACTTHSSKQCVGNSVYWKNSCGAQEDVFQVCSTNQICQNAQCVDQNIVCSTNSQCGTNGLIGSPFCQNGDVYKNFRTYVCNNAGTTNSSCSQSDLAQLQTDCTSSQTCSGGSCIDQNIVCSTNSQCGTNGLIGSPFCQNGDVYKNFRTYTCNNPGTTNSSCSQSDSAQLQTDCTSNQTCSGGSCVDQNIVCSTNSQCGTNGLIGDNFCYDGNVYKNYKTYTCNNQGTPNSYCSNAIDRRIQTTCTANQTCNNGACVDQNIVCSTNSQCGTSGYIGSNFCKNGDVYKSYRTYVCNNAGTSTSSCSNTSEDRLQTDCTASQTCSGGSCEDQNIACSTNSQCGTSGYIGSNFCKNGDVYKSYRTYVCHNAGTSASYCSNTSEDRLTDNCSSNETCNGGECSSDNHICTTQSYRQCSGNYLYWYDSCGNRGNVDQYCQNGCSGNACQNNIINSSVQTTQATNIFNNQATLNGYLSNTGSTYTCASYVWFQWGATTSYGNTTNQQVMNYTGAFSQNIFGTYPGNTYHFRAVARDCNGNTTYGQNQTFYVYPQVLGATTISTGLTNNFWMDSFILPLMVVLAFIVMFKMGMFVSIEKWLASKKLVRRNFKAENELSKRISNIRGI